MKTIGYEVLICTKVDHPEKRNDTYPKVPPNTYVNARVFCATANRATRLYQEVLEGEWDFESEYAKHVEVVRVTDGPGRQPTYRRRVDRTRGSALEARIMTIPDQQWFNIVEEDL